MIETRPGISVRSCFYAHPSGKTKLTPSKTKSVCSFSIPFGIQHWTIHSTWMKSTLPRESGSAQACSQ